MYKQIIFWSENDKRIYSNYYLSFINIFQFSNCHFCITFIEISDSVATGIYLEILLSPTPHDSTQ